MNWPNNFIRDFFNPSKPPEWTDTEELLRSVDYVINHSNLTDKQMELILQYYQQGKTYRAIGEMYSRCVENIRIPIRRAMVMMSGNPRNRMILTNGITAYEATADKTVYLEDLNLPMRIYNPLRVAGYKTAAQLAAIRNRDDLRILSRIGEKSIDDIVLALKKCGLEAPYLECK